jgi:hypothetical protein
MLRDGPPPQVGQSLARAKAAQPASADASVIARIEFIGLRFIQPYLKLRSVVQIAAAFITDPPATVAVGPA